jgi:hypothetical protein
MKIQSIICYLILAICLLALMPAVQAEDTTSQKVIYQTTFSTDPRWTTNSPSSDYWDSSAGMYHFSLEPSTGNYAYIPVEYSDGPFKLEYDVILTSVDEDTTFRLGFSGSEMDANKGPNVLTQFTNAKYGRIMWLHLVTPGNKMVEVNSQKGDTLSSGPKAYDGPTVKYELNKTYHVATSYDEDNKLLSSKVSDKLSGKEIWSYYVNTGEDLHGMNRIYVGSKGDYGTMGRYAQGFIDNVRLTAPVTVAVATTPSATVTDVQIPVTTQPTAKITTAKPMETQPVESPTTPQSPLSPALSIVSLCIAGVCIGLITLRRRN